MNARELSFLLRMGILVYRQKALLVITGFLEKQYSG
jgi:hypothetical protein